MEKIYNYLKTKPPLIIAVSFLLLIFIGSILLYLPISQAQKVSYLDCLFTSTSAVCVTGLVTVPTFSARTVFGKVIIALLIQIGGLGFMTFTTLLFLILKRKITLSDRIVLREQTNSNGLDGMVKLIRYILLATLAIEVVGFVLLMFDFVPKFGAKGIAYSIFHSISAFCNAGFDILGPDSLISYNHDKYLLLVIAGLIFMGSLGFVVILDLIENKFRFNKLHLHSKVVLSTTLVLIVFSTISFYIFEKNNPNTIGSYSGIDKLVNSFFQSITLRTAGFDSLNQANIKDASSALSIVNMFIGGSPAGTAGGIKTTTIALLIIVVISDIMQKEDVEAFKRRINIKLVRKAIGITVLALAWVSIIVVIILTLTGFDFLDVIFEVTSAFGTVGLSRNLTASLGSISKVLIILSMYAGRVGLITLIAALNYNAKKKLYREAEENIIIG